MKLFLIVLANLVSGVSFAQSNAQFAITRIAFGSGAAATVTNAECQLTGTLGQPATTSIANNRFTIKSGFWIWSAPTLAAPGNIGTNFLFSFQSESRKTYVVQYGDSLSPTNWQSLPGIAGDGTVKTVTNSVVSTSRRFYRLIEQ